MLGVRQGSIVGLLIIGMEYTSDNLDVVSFVKRRIAVVGTMGDDTWDWKGVILHCLR